MWFGAGLRAMPLILNQDASRRAIWHEWVGGPFGNNSHSRWALRL
jgi:hypothetical protein